MIKTVHENEYDLTKKGNFYRTKDGAQAFKCKKGNHYYWRKVETYGEYLKRIISCL